MIKIKIINFGSLNIDNSYKVPHFVRPGETLKSEYLEVMPGGKGLNQSIAISKAGATVYHAGFYGRNGEFLKDYLEENLVKTDYLNYKDVIQGHATIQVDDNGENSILLFGGSNTSLSEDDINNLLKEAKEGDFLILQNEVNNISNIVEVAFKKKMHIVFNPAPMNSEVFKVDLSKVSWLIVNEGEGIGLTNENSSEKIIEKLSQKYLNLNVILTLGSKGSICYTEGKTFYQNAFEREVVDTTGAGDTFIGYFVAGIVEQLNINDCLLSASVAASLSVGKTGAAPSIPLRQEVENEIKIIKGENI